MRRISIAVLLASALALPLTAETVTLDDALSAARTNNTTLESAALTLTTSLRNASNTSTFIPDISVSGSFTASGGLIPDNHGDTTYDASVGISLDLGTGDIMNARVNEVARQIANQTYDDTERSIGDAVAEAYWNLSTMDEAVAVAQSNLESAQQSLSYAEERYEAGYADSLTVSQAKLAVLDASSSLSSSQRSQSLARTTLNALTGLSGDYTVESLPDTTWLALPGNSDLYQSHSSSSPSIISAGLQVSQSEASLTQTKLNNYYPSLNVGVGYEIDVAETGVTRSDYWGDNAYVSVGVNIPISSYIPGSTANNTVKNAEDSVAQSKISLRAAREDLMTNIESLASRLESSRESIEIAESSVEVAQEAYDLTNEAWQAGYASTSDLTDARDSLYSAQLTLLSSRLDYQNNKLALATELGLQLDELENLYKETQE